MNRREFYDYIMENFEVSGDASRLINNILSFVERRKLKKDLSQALLLELLDGTIDLTEEEIRNTAI